MEKTEVQRDSAVLEALLNWALSSPKRQIVDDILADKTIEKANERYKKIFAVFADSEITGQ